MGDVQVSGEPQSIGHGVKQRDLVTMSPEEIDAFLHERRAMTMCTLNHDGSIHAVAMWYGFLDGSIAIETKAKSQKAVNLRRDTRITCMMDDGDVYEELLARIPHFVADAAEGRVAPGPFTRRFESLPIRATA